MIEKRDLLKKFLRGIETGDAMAAAVVNEKKYIQHNPQTHDSGEGIAALFARISKTNPKVHFMRVFEDGDFAFAHNEYDFADVKIAFEVFRFEEGRAVEHWDNIQNIAGPNSSGRGMIDGTTEISDLENTEQNRALVRRFVEAVLIGGDTDSFAEFVHDDLIQHSPDMGDGRAQFLIILQPSSDGARCYNRLHRVLAEGNFALCMSEGTRNNVHSGLYDLFRIEAGMIAEHWTTVETIPPLGERKNDNGKF